MRNQKIAPRWGQYGVNCSPFWGFRFSDQHDQARKCMEMASVSINKVWRVRPKTANTPYTCLMSTDTTTKPSRNRRRFGNCLFCGVRFERKSKFPVKKFCSDGHRAKYHHGETPDFQRLELKLIAKLSRMLTRAKKDLRAELLKLLADRDTQR